MRPPPEQPTAPYLDAATAYGFRGSTRFHIPGHNRGEGADLGLRAALGERVTADVVDYLRELNAAGARLHGAADPSFATVRVLAERPAAVASA